MALVLGLGILDSALYLTQYSIIKELAGVQPGDVPDEKRLRLWPFFYFSLKVRSTFLMIKGFLLFVYIIHLLDGIQLLRSDVDSWDSRSALILYDQNCLVCPRFEPRSKVSFCLERK